MYDVKTYDFGTIDKYMMIGIEKSESDSVIMVGTGLKIMITEDKIMSTFYTKTPKFIKEYLKPGIRKTVRIVVPDDGVFTTFFKANILIPNGYVSIPSPYDDGVKVSPAITFVEEESVLSIHLTFNKNDEFGSYFHERFTRMIEDLTEGGNA